jgi:beta-lactamase class A
LQANAERFPSASVIKVPILLAWLHLERAGLLNRSELADLDSLPQVQGAGISYLMEARRLPYHDLLLMMIALSDNLCTNLVIERIGLARLNNVLHEDLRLPGCEVQRKLMDFEARRQGLENWITASDAVRLFELVQALPADDLTFVEQLLEANCDDAQLKRCLPRDEVTFYHKTGSIPGVLNDWGYTRQAELFLFTSGVQDEPPVFEVFGQVGQLLADEQPPSGG